MKATLLVVAGVVTVGLVVGAAVYLGRVRGVPSGGGEIAAKRMAVSTTRATSLPVSRPSYLSLVAEAEPRLKRARVLDEPVNLESAAAIVTGRRVYLDGRGDLWITHPEAPGIEDVINAKAEPTTKPVAVYKEQVHFTRDEVVYAYWSRDTRGNFSPQVVTRAGRKYVWHVGGRFVSAAELERGDYRFESALLLSAGGVTRVVVPTGTGVSVLVPPGVIAEREEGRRERVTEGELAASEPVAGKLAEVYGEISGGRTAVGVFPVYPSGSVVAFRPWENGEPGSEKVLRLVTGEGGKLEWKAFEPEMFPSKPIHAFALTDGSTLVLSAGEDAGAELEVLLPFERKEADAGEVKKLIGELSAGNEEERKAAQGALARYGPSAWPVMEDALEGTELSGEARKTLTRLLGARAKPALGIFTLLPGPVRVMARDVDGALALYTFGGVSFLDLGKEKLRSPALLLAMPGAPVRLAHPSVMVDPDDAKGGEEGEGGGMEGAVEEGKLPRLQFRNGELLVLSRTKGLTRHMSNHLAPMLRQDLRGFQQWVGTDRMGRWVFKNVATSQYLILDPGYADPTPRLPAWTMTIDGGKTGWDARDNPVIARGEKQVFRLGASEWQAVDEGKAEERLVTKWEGKVTPSTTRLAPPAATGVGSGLEPGTVAEQVFRPGKDPEGPVFVYNRPGRILRYSKNEAGEYVLDAKFTEHVPKEDIRRVWQDPQGRLCIAHGAASLTILFPEGRYPPGLAPLITSDK